MLLLFSAQRELLLVVFEVFYFFHELSRNCSSYSARSMLLYVSLVGPPPLLGFTYYIRVCVSILLSITVLLKNCDLIAVRIVVVGSIRHS